MASKSISAWAGVALIEGGLLALLGPVSAIAAAVPLLIYGFWDHVEGFTKKWRLSKKWCVGISLLIAITVIGAEAWSDYYEPYRVAKEITLFERDSESWPGYKCCTPDIVLEDPIDPPLMIRKGESRRFNPQLNVSKAAVNLFGVTVLINFPAEAFKGGGSIVSVPDPDGTQSWTITESANERMINYFAPFKDNAAGDSGAPFSGFLLLNPSVEGRFEVHYEIRGRAENISGVLPLRRSFSFTVTP